MTFWPHFPPYNAQSGGVRVCYYLANLLQKAGHQIGHGGIAIYPDCYSGNPLGAERIVRFWCYYPHAYFGPATVPKSELVLLYHNRFRESAQKQYQGTIPERVFPFPSIEPGIFTPNKFKPIHTVWYVGKGNPALLPDNARPHVIYPGCPGRPSRARVIQWMKSARRFVSLDDCTIALVEAALCGCANYCWDGKRFHEAPVRDAGNWIMNPERDVELARGFAEEAEKFFGK